MAKRNRGTEEVDPTEDPSTAITNGDVPPTHVEAPTDTTPSLGFDSGTTGNFGQPDPALSASQTHEPVTADGRPIERVTDTGNVVAGPIAPGCPAPRDIVLYRLTAAQATEATRAHSTGTQQFDTVLEEGAQAGLIVSSCTEDGAVTGFCRPIGTVDVRVEGASQGDGPGQWSFPLSV